MTALTNQQVFAEIWYTQKLIKEILGVTPRSWRPPFGDVDDRVRFIAASLNLVTVLWSDDTFDYKVASGANTAGLPTASIIDNYGAVINSSRAGNFTREGAIILTHELNNATMSIARAQLPSLFGTFQHVMPVAACMNISRPYAEQSWTYATFENYLQGNNRTANDTNAEFASAAAYTGGNATLLSSGATTLPSTETAGAVVTSTNLVGFPTSTGAAAPRVYVQLVSVVLAGLVALAVVGL